MKKKITLSLLLFFAVVFLVGGYFGILLFKPAKSSNTQQRFVVPLGLTTSQVAQSLEKQGLISSQLVFRVYTRVLGVSRLIQAGEYDLAPSYSIPQIVSTLLKGPTEVWLTIPEGFRKEQIAEKAVSSLGLTGTKADAFLQDFLTETQDKEGYLFPDTYLLPKISTSSSVVRVLTQTFNEKVGAIDRNTVILASILERETLNDDERPVVAGILLKRLNAGWPLQADATVQYIRDSQKCKAGTGCKWWTPLVSGDLSIESAYNTYKFPGFPPTPISNPGLSSISAARSPKDSSYWYYLHDSSGNIHYATTLEEQNDNIKKYLQ